MKTLIFNGSPRQKGDTAGLLKIFTEHLEGDYKLVNAYRCKISPCVDCRYCWKEEGCCIQDEMQEVYAYIQECDHILIASPIYFSELTGPLLSVGSRLQTYFSARRFRKTVPIAKKKTGAVLLVGGGDGSPDRAFATAKVLLHDMNAGDILPLIVSHNTDTLPAVEDEKTVEAVKQLAGIFNKGPVREEDREETRA